MGAYLVRRLLLMALTLFGMSILIFVMLRLVPGNIADILVDAAGIADSKEKAKITHELGLDLPIIEQYGQWIGGLSRGDLGFAYVSERPAIEEIAPRIPIRRPRRNRCNRRCSTCGCRCRRPTKCS